MLTLQKLQSIQPDTAFASGTCTNSPEDIYMTSSNIGKQMSFVAVKGYNNDWAIYIGWAHLSLDHIRSNGDKLQNRDYIKKLVPCDEDALRAYRR